MRYSESDYTKLWASEYKRQSLNKIANDLWVKRDPDRFEKKGLNFHRSNPGKIYFSFGELQETFRGF